jgi:uncharacterized protein
MIESVFVDTEALFGIKCKADENHKAALHFFNFVLENNVASFVTTDFILFETVTIVKSRIDAQTTIDTGKQLRNSVHIKIVTITENIVSKAWDIFDTYADKDFSFVDCVSFAVMKELGIRKAFTFDRHFKQFWFEMVP